MEGRRMDALQFLMTRYKLRAQMAPPLGNA
jgi:hypothetical protein